MRNLSLEAAIWYLFTSPDFIGDAAKECEATMNWFGTLAVSRQVTGLGRNNQIFEKMKTIARDFSRSAELAKLDEYGLAWNTAICIRGDMRGILEQPLRSWMTEAEYNEFFIPRIDRISDCARQIRRALHNAFVGAQSFYHPDPDHPDRRNDDDGYPGNEIASVYQQSMTWYKEPIFRALPSPLPNYAVDKSVECRTGDEVPWTGVWCPMLGIENRSLTFAVKGGRMQPSYRVIKTVDERNAGGEFFTTPETIAEEIVWNPVVALKNETKDNELWAKAGEICPKAGIWQAGDVTAFERVYSTGETMTNLGSAYGLTVWRWLREC